MRQQQRPHDAGFTLIETLIAMLVMAIAVVAIVGALSAMIGFTSEHRGHAVVETGARSFAQAVEAQAQGQTTLAAGVSASATTLTVTNAMLVPPASAGTYVQVDREVMRVTAVNRAAGTLGVVRGVSSTPPAAAHASGAAVVPFTVCPSAATMTPDASTYPATKGLTYRVTTVEYWQPAGTGGSFVATSAAACQNDFDTRCKGDVLPECSTGLLRVTLAIKSSDTSAPGYDPRFKGVDTTTAVLVRRGGS